jgi:hypothetical protein
MQNLIINATCGDNNNVQFAYAIPMKNSNPNQNLYQVIRGKGAMYPEQTANCIKFQPRKIYGGKSKRSKSKRSKSKRSKSKRSK